MSDIVANKRIARNSIFMSIRMVIVLFLSLYTTRAVLQILGVEDYGVYNVVCGFVSMFSFLNTSLSNGIQRFYNFEYSRNGNEGANSVYCMAVNIQIILAIIVAFLVEIAGVWYIGNKMVIPPERLYAAQWIFHLSVISFVFVILQSPYSAAIMAHENLSFYSCVCITDSILRLIIVFCAPLFKCDSLILYGLFLTMISLLDFFLYVFYCKNKFDEIHYSFNINKELFISMIKFSGWNVFGSFSGVMKEQGINLVLNSFFGPVVNAARGVAAQVNAGLQGFVANIIVPARPQIIQSYAKGNVARTMSLTYTISKLSCIVLYLMALPISWEIDYVLHIWLGESVPEHSDMFVIIILITSLFNNLNAAISCVVHAIGKMKSYQVATSTVSLTAVPLAYVALKLGASPEWALWMVCFTMIFVQAVALCILKGLIKFSISEYCHRVLMPLLGVIALTIWIPGVIVCMVPPSFIRLLISVIVSCFSVMVSFYFIGLRKEEKEMIKVMINKMFSKFFRK